MSVFRSRPALRWLVPTAAAVVVIGGGAAAGTIAASADPTLPERSAAQLLVDVQNAKVEGLSGTIVQTADLGLPSLPGVTSGGAGSAELMKLVAGSNTARVWYAGEDKVRLAVLGTLGETDVIRNGSDVWLWRSNANSATHFTLPADAKQKRHTTLPQGVPSTPQEAADAALAAIDPTTAVTTTGAAKVAGRDAYELVLTPRDTASLVGQVRLAIDAEQHIPLGVDVYAKDATSPAVRIAFQQVSFATPDPEQFTFNPPPGTKVETPSQADIQKEQQKAIQEHEKALKKGPGGKPQAPEGTKVVGTGWTSVLVAKLPAGDAGKQEAGGVQQLDAISGALPKVSGAWGSGRLLQSALFSALLTDDGRVLVGAVAPEKLYEVAGQ
ncbi:sigma-E factor regulatory protein RseB domain-containing protein [Actinoplanes sp. NPDC049316]|uniref:LolA family protein n=1 Tax=Actinoplanes sp. NPDC049316 TaxID=3154727 RepID=UPI00342206DB